MIGWYRKLFGYRQSRGLNACQAQRRRSLSQPESYDPRAAMGALPARQGSKADAEFSAQSRSKPLSTRKQQELFRDFLRWKKSRAMQ
jgi:hypothetical protein